MKWADKKNILNHIFCPKRCMSCTALRSQLCFCFSRLIRGLSSSAMRTRRQKILEDRQAVVERLIAGETSLQIPDDLIFEILLRLPAKCIARGRCLSKLWASILDRQEFTDHYLKRSSARPQLLFAFQDRCKVFFFSAPQDDNSSLIPPVII